MRDKVRQKKEEQNHKLLDPDNFWSQTILDALGALFQNIRQCSPKLQIMTSKIKLWEQKYFRNYDVESYTSFDSKFLENNDW